MCVGKSGQVRASGVTITPDAAGPAAGTASAAGPGPSYTTQQFLKQQLDNFKQIISLIGNSHRFAAAHHCYNSF